MAEKIDGDDEDFVPYSNIRDYKTSMIYSSVTDANINNYPLNTDLFRRFERNQDIDYLGFPTDSSVTQFVKSHYFGMNQHSVLVSPYCTGRTQRFNTLQDAYVDEALIMKLKWPIYEVARKDKALNELWMNTCTNVLILAVNSGVPVALSVTMYERIFVHIDNPNLFKVHYVPEGDVLGEMFNSRLADEDILMSDIRDRYKNDLRLLKRFSCHSIINDLIIIKPLARTHHPIITQNWIYLALAGVVSVSNYEKDEDQSEDAFKWWSDFEPMEAVWAMAQLGSNDMLLIDGSFHFELRGDFHTITSTNMQSRFKDFMMSFYD